MKWELSCRHRNVLKPMEKGIAISRLAGGILMAVMWAYFINETKAVAKAAALFVEKEENCG